MLKAQSSTYRNLERRRVVSWGDSQAGQKRIREVRKARGFKKEKLSIREVGKKEMVG